MKNKNVHLKYSITIPKDLKINVFDLNIILGNLLNNAIRNPSTIKAPGDSTNTNGMKSVIPNE